MNYHDAIYEITTLYPLDSTEIQFARLNKKLAEQDITPDSRLIMNVDAGVLGVPSIGWDERDVLAGLNHRVAVELLDERVLQPAIDTAATHVYVLTMWLLHVRDIRHPRWRKVAKLIQDYVAEWDLDDYNWSLRGLPPETSFRAHWTIAGIYHYSSAAWSSHLNIRHMLAAWRIAPRHLSPKDIEVITRNVVNACRRARHTAEFFTAIAQRVDEGLALLSHTAEALAELGRETESRETKLARLGTLLDQGFATHARLLLEELEKKRETFDRRQQLKLLLHRADLLTHDDDGEAALAVLERCRPELDTLPDTEKFLEPYYGSILASALMLSKRNVEARAHFARTRERQYDPSSIGSEWANATTQEGVLSLRLGDLEYGENLLLRVDKELKEKPAQLRARMFLYMRWGDARYSLGDHDRALEILERALAIRRGMVSSTQTYIGLNMLSSRWAPIDELLVELYLRAERIDDAFALIEEGKGRGLMGYAANQIRPPSARLRELTRRYGHLVMFREHFAARDETKPIAKSISRMLTAVHEAAEREIASRRSWRADTDVREHTLDDVEQLLPDASWTLVSLFSTRQGTGFVALRRGSPRVGRWLPFRYSEFVEQLVDPLHEVREAYTRGVASQDEWQAALQRYLQGIHENLWAPLAADLPKTDHLLIIPHRGFHTVPWAAVPGLAKRYRSICVSPGAALLQHAASLETTWNPSAPLDFFANPDEQAPLTALELAATLHRWSGAARGHAGTECRPEKLFAAGNDCHVLHIASHGRWIANERECSGLLFQPPAEDIPPLFGQPDGLVNTSALLTSLNLPRCALALLSACESGVSVRTRADEPFGLPAALLLAGADQVIATMWRVRDDASLLLMDHFYREVCRGVGISTALANAQRELRELPGTEAAERIHALRKLLADPLPAELRRSANRAARRVASRLAREDRPFADPEHWGAFVCFGAPR